MKIKNVKSTSFVLDRNLCLGQYTEILNIFYITDLYIRLVVIL